MSESDIKQELRALTAETFEVVDLVDLGLDAASMVEPIEGISCWCSTSCCSTSACS